jgi:50S ribosomal protein L16 3-hydroxylase
MFMGQNCRSLEKRMKNTDLPDLLAGISPRTFMRDYWQKKPLLIRQAIPKMQALLSRQALFALAAQEEVESRLVMGDGVRQPWQMRTGPFKPRQLPALKQPNWTLLVQGADLHSDALANLRAGFRFIADARLDDVMVSYASDGGGVGPHFDSYDVFLLQAHGQRRWRIGAQKKLQLRDDVPLKILSHFKPTQTLLLEPGDMLYLPPHYAHEGVAVGECMTYSIGFKADTDHTLGSVLMGRLADFEPSRRTVNYSDPDQLPTRQPARIPSALQAFSRQSVLQMLQRDADIRCALGEWLSEPKSQVWFESRARPRHLSAVRLDRKTQMLYDQDHVFVNGESWRCSGQDARLLRTLADRRCLEMTDMKLASPKVRALLVEWWEAGWLNSLPLKRLKNGASGNHL